MAFSDLFKRKKKPEPAKEAGSASPPAVPSEVDALQAAFMQNLRLLNQKEYPPDFFHRLFQNSRFLTRFQIGEIDLPSGEIMVGDPLSYLGSPIYFQQLNRRIAPGAYPVELAIVQTPALGLRYAAARLLVQEGAAVRYEITMPYGKTVEQYNTPGVLTGFGVDTGLAGFCDVQTAEEYCRFFAPALAEKQNISGYFLPLFQKSYEAYPHFQRPGGDFLIYAVPDTGNRLAMFASGFGDGFYSAYWGLDEAGHVAELVIPLIHPDILG